ncbi:MAG: CehA/McbA family metallohydrolase [bacterium]
MNWFSTELHCHTVHSDGSFTVDELKNEAQQHELDGIALTDHNTVSGWAEATNEKESEAISVLKGIEWTTFYGHMLVMDCPVFVDWRDALPDSIDEKISQIRSHGGLVGIAHPYELGSPMCTGCYWDYHITEWENVNFIEVWSEAFPNISLSNQRAVELWNSVLDKGYHVGATYGRDWHRKSDESVPYA